jgi:hypothetical protein
MAQTYNQLKVEKDNGQVLYTSKIIQTLMAVIPVNLTVTFFRTAPPSTYLDNPVQRCMNNSAGLRRKAFCGIQAYRY